MSGQFVITIGDAGFLTTCHRAVLATGIIMATTAMAVAYEAVPSQWLVVASLISGLGLLVDLIANFSGRANLHTDLKRRFGDLQREIIRADEDGDIRKFEERCLEIEKDEPPIMCALDLLCHNELARAKNIKDIYIVPLTKRLIANVFAWSNVKLKKQA